MGNICTEFHYYQKSSIVASSYWTNQPVFFFETSHLCWLNRETECTHNFSHHMLLQNAVMEMQYMLIYNPVFVTLFVWLFSPHSLLYCTNSPNISNAMNRLLTFKLPVLISSHRMSVLHAEFIQRSWVFPLAASWDSQVCFGINHKQSVP